jgi:hypothetical protein
MYFRARYYDPGTGEFIRRDPLEYIDGMSLYRGYFIPSGTDPFGLERPTSVDQHSGEFTIPDPNAPQDPGFPNSLYMYACVISWVCSDGSVGKEIVINEEIPYNPLDLNSITQKQLYLAQKESECAKRKLEIMWDFSLCPDDEDDDDDCPKDPPRHCLPIQNHGLVPTNDHLVIVACLRVKGVAGWIWKCFKSCTGDTSPGPTETVPIPIPIPTGPGKIPIPPKAA